LEAGAGGSEDKVGFEPAGEQDQPLGVAAAGDVKEGHPDLADLPQPGSVGGIGVGAGGEEHEVQVGPPFGGVIGPRARADHDPGAHVGAGVSPGDDGLF
jgi:hypothetical protein